MPARALHLWMALQLLSWYVCAAATQGRNSTRGLRALTPRVVTGRDCPPCEGLFSKAKPTTDGKRIQEVEIQLRG